MALARDNVISHVYPLEPNREALGTNLQTHPRQGASIRRMLSLARPVIDGPVRLVQGDRALVLRVPIYEEQSGQRRYWGLLSVPLRIQPLLEAAGLMGEGPPVGLRTEPKGEAQVLAGDAEMFGGQALRLPVPIADRRWELATSPPPPTRGLLWWLLGLGPALPVGLLAWRATSAGLALQSTTARLHGLMAALPDIGFILDAEGRYLDVFGGRDRTRYSSSEGLVGQRMHEVLPAPMADRFLREVRRTISEDRPRHLEYSLQASQVEGARGGPAGTQWFEGRLVPLRKEVAGAPAVLWVAYNVTDRKRLEEELLLSAQVFDNAQEGIIVTDAQNRIVRVNPAFTRISGYREEEVIGRDPKLWASGLQSREFYQEMWRQVIEQGHWSGELWNRHKDGSLYPQSLSISAIRDEHGLIVHHLAIMNDITERKEIENQIRHLALYDALTDLANRTLLGTRLGQAVAAARREGKHPAVLFLDLDDFKPVNDAFGHEAGDRALVEVARRLQSCVRQIDTVARMGGDEFVVLLSGPVDEAGARRVAEKILTALAEPIDLPPQQWQIGVSIGIGLYPQHGDSVDALLRAADDAMYLAKAAGKNTYRVYPGGGRERVRGEE